MDFNIVEIFKRSITIELSNDFVYELSEKYDIYINNLKHLSSNRNVVSIFNLTPDSEYEIYIQKNGIKSDIKKFKTKYEYVLLNVKDFGAKGDERELDSIYIQAAISSCPNNGTVYIPKGRYICTPLFLKSNIDIWIDKDAVILGEIDRKKYPILQGMITSTDEKDEYNLGTWEGNPLNSFASLITGINVSNVDIYGEGIIDGNANNSDWWKNTKSKNIAWRPNMLFLHGCNNIRIQGLTITNSPCWTLHPYYSDNLKFLNNTIINPENSPNTDGIDPESCENVLILGVIISVGDDCIAIKSGKYYMAMKHYKTSKNIEIRNCKFEKGHGSVTIGSEVAAGVSNVRVSKCLFYGTDRGVRIKTRRGRGKKSILTNFLFDNIIMKNVKMPFTINMFYFCDPDGHSLYVQDRNEREVDEKTPLVGKVELRNISCENVRNVLACVYGLPEMPISELIISNLHAVFDKSRNIIPLVPLMMDNFPKMVKRGIFAKNIKKLVLVDICIAGSKDSNVFVENISSCTNSNVKFIK